MQKPLGIQKCDGPTDGRTDLPTDTERCRVASPRLEMLILSFFLSFSIGLNSDFFLLLKKFDSGKISHEPYGVPTASPQAPSGVVKKSNSDPEYIVCYQSGWFTLSSDCVFSFLCSQRMSLGC